MPMEGDERWASMLSVSAFNGVVRTIVEKELPQLWVKGEVAGWKSYPSGHCYFTLRDAHAHLRCVMFREDAKSLPAQPEDGMEVCVFGKPTIYERRGEFQLVARRLEASRSGGLWRLAFEKLHRRLEAEGLFSAERKRPLPRYPVGIGVVTSSAGAALQDILMVLARRAPWIPVFLSPAQVQGDGAAESVSRAIRSFDGRSDVDVLIVGRGGGSVEDLWAFNEEPVARAIADSSIPVISGVGHEVDVTMADLVADFRAPTPSSAAEHAVPEKEAVLEYCANLGSRIRIAMEQVLDRMGYELETRTTLLEEGVREVLRRRRVTLRGLAGRLESLSPLAALRRGYSVVESSDGKVLRRVEEFSHGMSLVIRVTDGSVACRVEGVAPEEDA